MFNYKWVETRLIASLLFQPLIQPSKEFALPQHGVLRFRYEVALLREVEEAARNALHLGSIEGLHALGVGDAEVLAAVDDQNRGVPKSNELVR